ncbi:inositol monophosphatase [Candidatus Acetothermia bacterium]|nr:inositol monophosphatase [Candidatus Acetothermia bacterium]
MLDYTEALELAVSLSRQAGRLLKQGLRIEKQVTTKLHQHDFVTEFDIAAEKLIIDGIRAAFPGHAILSEEQGSYATTSPYRWIIDPLDGTSNFICGYPHFAVSIALEVNQKIEISSIYDPTRDELFTAITQKGAMLNGEVIRVSQQSVLDGSLIETGFSSWLSLAAANYPYFKAVLPYAQTIRNCGSAALALAYVAAGRLNAAWYLSLAPWDIAAGTLLVEEAGGRVSDLDGKPLVDAERGVLATNQSIHCEMVNIFKNIRCKNVGRV